MPHNRYYLDAAFEKKSTVCLAGDEWGHLAKVLKSREGDIVELVNGKGQLAKTQILKLKKGEACLYILQVDQGQTPPNQLILAQGLPRMNHLEWIIEKATELNADALWLFPGALSEKPTLSQAQEARAKHLAIAAMKQCGRLTLPAIVLKPPLAKWSKLEGTLLFGDTADTAPYLWDALKSEAALSPFVVFIGPEKGFSAEERGFLLETLKAKGVRLHPNTLRAETASLVALSLMQPYLR